MNMKMVEVNHDHATCLSVHLSVECHANHH